MNSEELKNELQGFKQACCEKKYIYDVLTFDEAYPDVEPTSFIVNMVVQKTLKGLSRSKMLDKFIKILWDTTEKETRENIFTLNFHTIDEMVNSERKKDRAQISTNPDLTSEQIKKLSSDTEKFISDRVIIAHQETSGLTKKEMYRIFDTNDDDNIDLLTKRLSKDEDFKNLALKDDYLKLKVLQYTI